MPNEANTGTRAYVPGKQVTVAHLIAHPAPEICEKAGIPDVDAIGILYDRVAARGARIIGFTPTEGYDFVASAGERDGHFLGLALDEDNQSDLTERRIAAWIKQLS